MVNRQFVLASRPAGMVKESDFRLVETPVPTLHAAAHVGINRQVQRFEEYFAIQASLIGPPTLSKYASMPSGHASRSPAA